MLSLNTAWKLHCGSPCPDVLVGEVFKTACIDRRYISVVERPLYMYLTPSEPFRVPGIYEVNTTRGGPCCVCRSYYCGQIISQQAGPSFCQYCIHLCWHKKIRRKQGQCIRDMITFSAAWPLLGRSERLAAARTPVGAGIGYSMHRGKSHIGC